MEVFDDTVDILSWLDNAEPAKPLPQAKSTRIDTLTSPELVGTSLEINREVLLSLLEKAIGVVPSRDIIPVLTNFQFQVFDDQLKVIASSRELSIIVSTSQVNTKVTGTQVFPARTLLSIIKESNAGSDITIEVTSTGAAIASGGFSANINLPNGSDFPSMDAISDITFHEVDRAQFVASISRVKYALPSKEYSGMDTLKMISIKGGKFTACDGSRFQQVRVDNFKLHMQLPTSSIAALIKVLSSTDQEILEIGETENNLVFRLNNLVFYMSKMDDPYPNVEQLWLRPALSNDEEFVVDKQQLITAIKQVKIAADADLHAIGLILEEDQVIVTTKNNNNSAKVVVPCKWGRKTKNIVVNYMHLAEMLKAYEPAVCRFLLGEETKTYKPPILLKDDDTMAIATIAQMMSFRAGL